MNDKPADLLPITDPHSVLPIFVNQIAGSGQLGGVFNLTFATALFTPTADNKIDADIVVSARLRMDFSCLQQLHQACEALIAQNTKPDGVKDN
jgi:hypothetical protein